MNWGDGTAEQTYPFGSGTSVFTVSHVYLDDGPAWTGADQYTIRVAAVDDEGGVGEAIICSGTRSGPLEKGLAHDNCTVIGP